MPSIRIQALKKLFGKKATPEVVKGLQDLADSPLTRRMYGSPSKDEMNIVLRYQIPDMDPKMGDRVISNYFENVLPKAELKTGASIHPVPRMSHDKTTRTIDKHIKEAMELDDLDTSARGLTSRIGSSKDWIRIAGITSAMGGAMLGESEAEASPIGNVIKNAAKKVVGGVESSTAKRLIGTEFKGQKITKVTKGAQNWRYIHLDDDTVYPVTKDVLHDLSRKAGTDDYLGRLATKDEPSKLVQALKSLDYHRARSIPAGSKMMMREYYKQWTAQLKEAGLPSVPTCMVRSGKDTFLMPTEYAEMLEKEGHLKILKRLQ